MKTRALPWSHTQQKFLGGFCSLSVLTLTLTLPAQDWVRSSAPSQFWSGIACSADGSKIVAASRFTSGSGFNPGAIYRSTNSGRDWQITSAPIQYWGSAVSSADGVKLAVVGADNPGYPPGAGIYLSTNSGVTWARSSAPANTWGPLTSSTDGSKLAAAVWAGPIYLSADSGATWTPSPAPSLYWFALAASADGQKLAASGGEYVNPNQRQIFISADFGKTWTAVSNSPTTIIALTTSADGSQWLGTAGPNGIYISADSGHNWDLTSAPGQDWLAIASAADGSRITTVGMTYVESGYAPGPIYTSSTYGKEWAQSGTVTGYFNNVCCSRDGTKWVAAEGGFAEGFIYTFQIPPTLSIQAFGSDILLSWPASATGFTLQQNSSLRSPGSWLPTTNSVQLVGETFQVIIPRSAGNNFYRLISQ